MPHATPLQLLLSAGNNQIAPAGTTLPNAIVVQVLSSTGAAMPNAMVQFTPSPGSGQVGLVTVTTDAQGKASTTWTLGTIGIESVTATLPGLTPATVTFSAIATNGSSCPVLAAYTFGTVINDVLTTSSCSLNRPPDTSPYYVKGYAASVTAGQAVQLTETSTAFVPRIDVGIEPSGNWSIGFGPATGSTQVSEKAILPAGPFVIRAGTLNASATGAYGFTAQPVSSNVTNCENVVLASGAVTSQTLATGDCSGNGKLYDQYLVGIPPGWTADITMTSSTVDSYLELFSGSTLLGFDDDGGGGLNSHLRYTSADNIGATLWATSFSGSDRGAYTLSLTLTPPVSGLASQVGPTGAVTDSSAPRPTGPPHE